MVITDGDKTLFLDISSRSSIGRDVDWSVVCVSPSGMTTIIVCVVCIVVIIILIILSYSIKERRKLETIAPKRKEIKEISHPLPLGRHPYSQKGSAKSFNVAVCFVCLELWYENIELLSPG